MLVSNYELLRSFDLATSLLDILIDIEPLPGRQQIGFKFAEIMKAEGLEAAIEFFKKTHADSAQRNFYIWDENDAAIAYPGYLFMQNEMYPEALEMFKFNVEQFPNSGWAHAHLATGYAQSGDNILARQYFEKAIQLLPDEPSFKEELSRLGK
jgi:tetratricopeptide (TPR) repeat protein